MATEIPLRCTCGKVRGVATDVSPDSGGRIVCYCDDCQAFARFLERSEVMNAAGGTDIFQMPPSSVRITEGADLLRCMRLSEKGLIRWYTDCCRTPVGNTLGARVPFVGLIQPFMDHEGSGRSRDDVIGKPLAHIFGKYAVGGVPPGAHPRVALGLMPRFARLLFGWWIAGKGEPSAFFDPKTKAPRAKPRVLSAAERQAVNGASPNLR
jgi:hypothetical protein